ncbi:MAG TPA: hypothetical protein PLR65_02380 [Anaerolineales bacterium]|nr:hypothetical protein [Anaerolineales bacterium]
MDFPRSPHRPFGVKADIVRSDNMLVGGLKYNAKHEQPQRQP